ncbi:MAG: hypothetical protein WBD20_20685 [Pirellulaceae bacterium]
MFLIVHRAALKVFDNWFFSTELVGDPFWYEVIGGWSYGLHLFGLAAVACWSVWLPGIRKTNILLFLAPAISFVVGLLANSFPFKRGFDLAISDALVSISEAAGAVLLVLAFGMIRSFRLVDLCQESSGHLPHRTQWSIRGLVVATAIIGAIIANQRWFISIYEMQGSMISKLSGVYSFSYSVAMAVVIVGCGFSFTRSTRLSGAFLLGLSFVLGWLSICMGEVIAYGPPPEWISNAISLFVMLGLLMAMLTLLRVLGFRLR